MTDEEYKNRKKFLLRFLKENGVYSRYLKYIKSPVTYNFFQKHNPDWTFDKCAKLYGMSLMVTRLILWNKTPEGVDFWENLQKRYIKEYTSKFKKTYQ